MKNRSILSRPRTHQPVGPLLRKVLRDAETEERELDEMFALLGWSALHEEIKLEIRDDVRACAEELRGNYSTSDPYVLRRRQRVDYWVRASLRGQCTVMTAVRALRTTSLQKGEGAAEQV